RGQPVLERLDQSGARLRAAQTLADGHVGAEIFFPVGNAAIARQIAELLLVGVKRPARLRVGLGRGPDVVEVRGVAGARGGGAARGGVRRALGAVRRAP